MAKSADEARKSAMAKKPATRPAGKLPKGGGKGLSGDALVGNVSASTIKDIKRMGMTAALKLAGTNGKTAGGAAREFQEGVRRMYGADRLAAAKAKYGPAKSSSPDAARRSSTMAKPSKPVAKSADAARMAALQKSRGQNMPYKGGSMGTKAPMKKSGTTDPFAKAVFGAGRAVKKAITGGANNGMTAAQVAAENKRRAAAAKKTK